MFEGYLSLSMRLYYVYKCSDMVTVRLIIYWEMIINIMNVKYLEKLSSRVKLDEFGKAL